MRVWARLEMAAADLAANISWLLTSAEGDLYVTSACTSIQLAVGDLGRRPGEPPRGGDTELSVLLTTPATSIPQPW